MPRIGSDIAVLLGIGKVVIDRGAVDLDFIQAHTEGGREFRKLLEQTSWEEIEAASGVPRNQIERAGDIYAQSSKTIFAWTMGITHHAHGVENVQAIAGLAMMRGMLGRPGCGLLPLRGHSNVQGMGSLGVAPRLKETVLENLQAHFGVTLPEEEGLDTLACIERAHAGGIDAALCLGGNLFGSNPTRRLPARRFARLVCWSTCQRPSIPATRAVSGRKRSFSQSRLAMRKRSRPRRSRCSALCASRMVAKLATKGRVPRLR